MARFWYNRIKMGKATIDDVPDKWKEEVKRLISEEAEGSID